ncbi:MAG: AmmeMemoRadiSam system protein B [Candidatus Omnitrophica bacterium]|nr:AmmeMemoRadiSam system protein B [Candidatus Omnitrophota bacterium]MCM8798842.1 AmmeMemoRadiSam system protein B [Candidatus Omnitrophota bacterium]
MRRNNHRLAQIFILVTYSLLLATWGWAQEEQFRQPAVSGLFYPREPEKLEKMIKGFLEEAQVPIIEGEIRGLIVPHAGYEYSGRVAAYAYKLLKDKKFDTVIILGPSHRVFIQEASLYNLGGFLTPLGIVSLDRDLIEELTSPEIKPHIEAHRYEHSLEVQLPFLQVVLREFKIVPILINNVETHFCKLVAKKIAEKIKDKNFLVIASTDLSHYHNYQTAENMDKFTLGLIEKNRIEELAESLKKGASELCGAGAVLTFMLLMQELGIDKIKVLKYSHSGEVNFDFSRVVGYSAIAFYKEKRDFLSEEVKKELLKIARKTLEVYLKEKRIPEFKIENPSLLEKRGAFVTLKKKGILRGCIGNFEPLPLYLQIQKVALSSALNDFRFLPVRFEELKDIGIEISILSPMREIKSLEELELGKHGIYVTDGLRSGVFLPQVARETGWSKEEFLRNCFLEKAGLPPEAWGKTAKVFVFTAEVFSEKEFP